MGDSVQYALDRMAVDLEDLRFRGIFSETEIRAIVAKRRDFEYMLRRHETRKLDFMRYVEHELNLETLRDLRTKRIEGAGYRQSNKKKNKKNGKGAAAASDYSCVRLVRWIFDRAVMKFPGDVDIWLHYIDFAVRQGQSKMLGKLCARALQLHPRNAGLWIKAASWEFFDAGNASSARALMQRGLRINPSAKKLWLQYFRLEFCYVDKLMGRREVLGLEEDTEEEGGEGEIDAMDIPTLEGEGEGAGGPSFKTVRKAEKVASLEGTAGGGSSGSIRESSRRPAPVMNDTARRFYKGAVPLAVFRAAVKAVPEDVEFRAGFLRCCAVDFPVLGAEVARAVLDSIAQDFPESCEAWELRASYPVMIAGGEERERAGVAGEMVGGPAVQGCIEVFERAVEAVGSRGPGMWVRYASFLRGRLEGVREEDDGAAGSSSRKKRRKKDRSSGGGNDNGEEVPAAVAAALAVRLQGVLTRAVEAHLCVDIGNSVGAPLSISSSSAIAAAGAESATAMTAEKIAARQKTTGGVKLATVTTSKLGCVGASGNGGEAQTQAHEDDNAREALSSGLADVCLALGNPDTALAALRTATRRLPGRAGPWLRRAAFERRLAVFGRVGNSAGAAASIGGRVSEVCRGGTKTHKKRSSDNTDGNIRNEDVVTGITIAMSTLRAGLKSVPPNSRGYASLWRELLASLIALGGGKKAVDTAFKGAVVACNPSGGGDQGNAQGEFLAGYLRWSGSTGGVEAVRRVFQWARRSFLLSGTGAAVAYNDAIEAERMELDGPDRGGAGSGAGKRIKRVRELFEDATDKFGKAMPNIWEEYAAFEIKEGDVKRANAVRWRASQQHA